MTVPRWLRWLFGRRAKPTPPAPPPPQCPSSSRAAAEARRRAEARLRHTISQQPEVEEAARTASRLRAQNHFGEAIERALRRRAA